MKQFNIKKLFLAAVVCSAAGSVNGQTILHPLSFSTPDSAYYKDYVGLRFEVTQPYPSAIAKEYLNTPATIGTAAGDWCCIVNTPQFDVPVVMAQGTDDSCGCSAFTGSYMAGKVALIWRGPVASPCSFSLKAYNAQQAGATAVVLINEYPHQGPFAPGSTTGVGTVTIPVFMISNDDGEAIDAQYHALPTNTIKMTITPWGENLQNDLGFVPGGTAFWHDYAAPANQVYGSTALAYKGLDGAYIANFGTHNNASTITIKDSLTFSPGPTGSTGGTPTVMHNSSIVWPSSDSHMPFTPLDSVFAVFSTSEYDLGLTGTPATGRFDLTYTLSSDSVDQNLADNVTTSSFYLTDSLYSKGRYDFNNSEPVRAIYEEFGGGVTFMSGPMYYVGAKTGTAVSRIQYSFASNTTGDLSSPSTSNTNDVLIYKWVDGDIAADSVVQNGELELVSLSTYGFGSSPADTSEGTLNLTNITDSTGNPMTLFLDPNSWYYISVETPGGLFLGMDGIQNPLPRVFGRYHADNGLLDYSSVEISTTHDSIVAYYGGYGEAPLYARTSLVASVDSYSFNTARGLIPAVALIVNSNPDTTNSHVGVNNIAKQPFANVSLYPNPATDYINVSVQLDQPAKTITYKIIDGLGRFVSQVTHNNLQEEVYKMPVNQLVPGSYYLLVNANGKALSKKFTVIR